MADTKKLWKLKLGSHQGTFNSRDHDVYECESLDACRQLFKEKEKNCQRSGLFVWYAKAEGPNGEVQQLHPGTPYKSEME